MALFRVKSGTFSLRSYRKKFFCCRIFNFLIKHLNNRPSRQVFHRMLQTLSSEERACCNDNSQTDLPKCEPPSWRTCFCGDKVNSLRADLVATGVSVGKMLFQNGRTVETLHALCSCVSLVHFCDW